MYLWKKIKNKLVKFLNARPFVAFFVFLFLLFILIVIGNFLRKPAAEKPVALAVPKSVEIFSNSDVPTIRMQAKIEKTGALTIVAQSAGVVQAVRVVAGAHVLQGASLFGLSTNYQGGNAADLSRQIAATSYQSSLDNYNQQQDLIAKERTLASSTNAQVSAMLDISRQSIDDTNSLITADQGIVDSLSGQISAQQASNVGGNNNATILGLQQAQAGAMSALLQLRTSQRTLTYQTNTTKEPTILANTQRDLTLEQLDLQAKALDVGRQIAGLNLKLTQVMEALMYPVAPVSGTIERVFVHVGQVVSPGTVLASLRADKDEAEAIVLVDDAVANQISSIEPSVFLIAGKSISVRPRVIAREPTDAGLHAITYTLPSSIAASLSAGTFVGVNLPLASTRSTLVVPLKAVYQTPEKTYVYVVVHSNSEVHAEIREIKLGDVYGEFVPVLSGLTSTDQVILTRTVKDGDLVNF